jgi:Tfp pilus assembly protein PilN
MKQINLIPSEYAHSRYVRRRAAIWAELVLAVSAMVGALALNLHGRLEAAGKENTRLTAKVQLHQQLSMQLQALTAEETAVVAKLKEIYAAQQRRVHSAILHDIATACNDKVFLVEVAIGAGKAHKGLALPNPRGAGKPPPKPEDGKSTIVLRGFALTNLDLTRFVSELSKAAMLKDVTLKFWRQETVETLKLISFEIESTPNIET